MVVRGMKRRALIIGGVLVGLFAGVAQAQEITGPGAGGGGSGGSSGPLPGQRTPYIGYVSNNTNVMDGANLAQTWIKSDEAHMAKVELAAGSWAPCYANWYVAVTVAPNNGTEQTTGVGTVYGWVDYPVGVTKTPLTFSGNTSGTFGATASLLCADMAGMPAIPAGATFRLRQQLQSPGGIPYQSLTGDDTNRSQSGTGTGTLDATQVVSLNGASLYGPVLIKGYTTQESIAGVGDSRFAGLQDVANSSLNRGEFARTAGSKGAYSKIAVPSDRVTWMASNFTQRSAIVSLATKIISEPGINDAFGGRSSAQILADLQTLYALPAFAGKPIAQATLYPIIVTTTDAYTTEANQTAGSSNAVVQTTNNAIRAGTANVRAVVDIAGVVESPTKPGVFRTVPDGAGGQLSITNDGSHTNPRGELLIQSSRVIEVGMH